MDVPTLSGSNPNPMYCHCTTTDTTTQQHYNNRYHNTNNTMTGYSHCLLLFNVVCLFRDAQNNLLQKPLQWPKKQDSTIGFLRIWESNKRLLEALPAPMPFGCSPKQALCIHFVSLKTLILHFALILLKNYF